MAKVKFFTNVAKEYINYLEFTGKKSLIEVPIKSHFKGLKLATPEKDIIDLSIKSNVVKTNILSSQVLNSFNTWRFKSEQPKDKEAFLNIISNCINEDKPIKFALYWGKGDRNIAGVNEKAAFKYLSDFFNTLKKEYPKGSEVSIIFTDTHAKLNGYSNQTINEYYSSISKMTEADNFKTVLLSDLIGSSPDKPLITESEYKISDALFKKLKIACQKHDKSGRNIEEGAKLYFQQTQIENKIITQKYHDNIFLTYNSSDYNEVLPTSLPIFYMNSIRKGIKIKPWFMD